ncbi:TMEM175 family protein [Frondihabitans sp. 4ASC-45]|uniref:TMEM175 family protein n=1 Tax=Frondihabitans sp. 4ASC-45 TaxID=3111636 RepID=UPI003C1C1EBB
MEVRTERGLDRLVNFSDATVAIAITLLILPLVDLAGEVKSESLGSFFHDHLSALTSFAITFAVIGRFWSAHHRVFEFAIAYDHRIVTVNLVWLASIVFLPFAANILSNSSGEPSVSALYIGTMIVTSGAAAVLDWLLVHTPGLGNPETIARLQVSTAVVFTCLLVLSMLIAVVFPVIGLYALLLLLLAPAVGRFWSGRRAART